MKDPTWHTPHSIWTIDATRQGWWNHLKAVGDEDT